MDIKNCPFCNEPATEPDENNHVMCSAVWCGSDAYMHVDAWNNRPLVKEYARIKELEDELGGWETIDSAPKDGTVVDLWHEEFGRQPDCYWGKPQHSCGEYGKYCDSDWHGEPEGWVDSACNSISPFQDECTHWMPLPKPPEAS